MTKLKWALPLLTLLGGCAASGLPIEPAATERNLEITRLEAPAVARAGEPLTVNLTARLYGAGWKVGQVRARVDADTGTIVVAGTAVPGPATPAAAGGVVEVPATVTFTPLAGGTYRFDVPFGSDRARLERTIRIMD